ncbi:MULTISPECIES: hypothetical protein [unclassified Nocardioides]|uniref:hypothetical protein n=1 Tax=unclassified Nocardioides TaxID=2615069 RepID=UPI0000570FC7|nr:MULTISPECIES: hypothetical protein [unclassified Nocardioides]ABL80301.1 conserved hypothetical protein [Nocardioides sp. JS614]
MAHLFVPSRFCGPPSSGNGGWTSGALAGLTGIDPAAGVSVSLRRPPPLDTPMPVATTGAVTAASLGDEVIARAEPVEPGGAAPPLAEPVPPAEARAAETSYAGLSFHPFPTCFACGVSRTEGDGLRIFPGRVTDQDGAARVAATWTPDPSVGADGHVTLPVTWAALDCVGGWAGDLEERLMVLVRMAAWVDAIPQVGEEHVVVGLARGSEGRKTFTASTLYDADGRVVARAEHLWVAVDPADL